ncbi:RelA/SpoT family protein [Acidiluteibacter ferrifornacis]|uniref:RelA/SpoT family protein n=1 Tax=Acidiluteibacter ferrifornacis TaxID=2692424 RepID=A0A6N9NLQ5_9FLAO|nr:RelA/SpoT family protein [Acidiluteibacter ferrifornacis]NBG66057.1 RelA/SpoT family protein [Acidiluteibacter ferrifornacis]
MIPIELEAEKKEILKRYKHLLKVSKLKDNKDKKLIRKAFDTALEAHKDMRRKTGEPYIYHPIEVARIVAEEIGLGATSIVCALLHDTVEDTDMTLDDVKRMFGPKAEKIIDGLTKISGVVDHNVSLQAENFRKILLTLSDDVRVILIKLADRLHNMRTLESMRRDKQLKIASETLYLFAPLAHRLGLYSIKSELEDLSLKYTEPEIYEEITSKLKKTKAVRTRFVNQFSLPIQKALQEQGFNFEIKARTKSIHSIFDKIKNKHVSFEEIYDIFAIRIIVDSAPEREKADCWNIYSIVTDFYQPSPDRLRDWISTPRANGYESLHTTVMSPTGKWVEVQIRSQRMDEIAEKGYAAHWKYKEGGEESNFDTWINKIRELLENPESNAIDFLDDFKLNLFAEEIFVFTPQGDVKSLPVGATALDFAFEIHSQVGERCIGAKVNTKLVPLSHVLNSGDQVEIITSRKQKPNESWLDYVITGKAKSKIRSALKEDKKRIAVDGKATLEKKLKKLKIPFTNDIIKDLLSFYRLPSPLELYYKIAINKVKLGKLDEVTYEGSKLVWNKPEQKINTSKQFEEALRSKGQADEMLVIGEDMEHFDYKISPCCNPIPGDEVFGFITISDGIKIHKTNCPNAVQLLSNYAYRVVKARWTSQEQIAFLAGIKVTGIDDVGIVNNITKLISMELNVNMRSISFDSNDGIFEGTIMVFVHDTRHLTDLIKKLKNVNGVINISRIDTA